MVYFLLQFPRVCQPAFYIHVRCAQFRILNYTNAFFLCCTCRRPLPPFRSTQTLSMVALEADRQAGVAALSARVTPGFSRCIERAHNQCGTTGLGPRSESLAQNQLAFKLMKRVTKRTLSLVERQTGQQLDRQAARNWVLIILHGGAL